ncbi:unnamed protein product [Microthlaspi erraticum]|uniref:PGG domain-containing protein n=1 Tax=Microthlaspi erraticum TaxID=1685480 RepID=A0A6D2J1Z4_9BRAS|nr:unnamed protein product [Microthlaspi erraticum]
MDSSALRKTVWKDPFKFTSTKVLHGGLGEGFSYVKEVPNDLISSQIPPNEISAPASRIDGSGKITNIYYDYIQLSQAISQGNVESVKKLLRRRPDALNELINPYETPLLKACVCGDLEIVKLLLRCMKSEGMLPKTSQNTPYHTPLAVVAFTGNVEIAKYLLSKDFGLLQIPGINGQLPVVVAVENGHRELARYLTEKTLFYCLINEDDGYHATMLVVNAIYYNMLDIALHVIGGKYYRYLAVTKHLQIESSPVVVLASKPDLFPCGCHLGPLERFIYSCIQVKHPTTPERNRPKKDQQPTLMGKMLKCLSKWTGINQVYQLKVMHVQAKKLLLGISEETLGMGLKERSETVNEALLFAARFGNVDFLVEMIKNNSELLWSSTSLFLLAVEFRQEKVFSLLYGLDDRKYLLLADKDCNGNSMLHLAGYLSPPSKLSTVTGAALQMQRELHWFKEVERIVPGIEKERANADGKRPMEIFTKEHQALRQEAEKWMKDTAMSCSLVAALIFAVTFAAVFTFPGGGKPFHLGDRNFITFLVSTLISCLASCTSVLIFLWILTARYSLDDFLVSLPTKMIAGLSIQFISIAAMLMAFSSALFVMLDQSSWISLACCFPTILLACFLALLFLLLQYPLLKEMTLSTYGKGIFDRNMKCWLHDIEQKCQRTSYNDEDPIH